MLKDYKADVQRLFLEMMLEDAESYVRVQNIFNPENFDRALRPAAEFVKTHCDAHKTMPDRAQIAATTGIKLQSVPDLTEGHFDWFLKNLKGSHAVRNWNAPSSRVQTCWKKATMIR